MDVKTEYDGEDPDTIQEPGATYSHLQDALMVGTTNLLIKEENDFIMKTENEVDELMIKEELDIGPTVLPPQITPSALPLDRDNLHLYSDTSVWFTSGAACHGTDKTTQTVAERRKKQAGYQKAYRERKKQQKQENNITEKDQGKIAEKRRKNAEYQRAHRERQKKLKKEISAEQMKQQIDQRKKKQAEVQKAYRERKKKKFKEASDLLLEEQRKGPYQEGDHCVTPNIIVRWDADVLGDGNCLFHSSVIVLAAALRSKLLNSALLQNCTDPAAATASKLRHTDLPGIDPQRLLYLAAKMLRQRDMPQIFIEFSCCRSGRSHGLRALTSCIS
ncbi:hypothetical protein EVAR_102907_1 [Eumeta japonica]|uniref:OTU domain-containing protein n=1 Tax=Eumeta variegata TaxID=151549 RepID=A0A4C1ZP92_EUMVA|nr:hypothetical protein EVAR_102907_1 [Eumeta japonica]